MGETPLSGLTAAMTEAAATSRMRPRDRALDIWIVHTGEPLPGAGAEMHAMPLARELSRRGHRVLWWNTAFDHFTKTWTYPCDTELRIEDNLSVFAIKGPGYRTNTSMRRLLDHRVVARRWRQLASGRRQPDLLVVAMPPHDLAYEAVRFAASRRIPSILDLRDPWPDALLDLIPRLARPAAKALLVKDFWMLRSAISSCDSMIAVTQSLLDWGREKAARITSKPDRVFYTGAARVSLDKISEPMLQLCERLRGSFVVVFVGSFGFYHSPFVVIEAAKRLADIPVQFVLAGTGDTESLLRSQSESLHNVHFTGWLSGADAAALMRLGSVGICPTTRRQPILPNKAAAYLREGLPVVSAFDGDLRRLIDEHDVGVNYTPADVSGFTDAIRLLYDDEPRRNRMSANATRLYGELFDAERNLSHLADHAESLAMVSRSS